MAETAKSNDLSLEERLRTLVEEVLAGTPHYVVDLDVRGAPGARVAELFLDSDGPLGVDDLARLSRDLEFLIDTEELFQGMYRLDVSTPGVNRPLKLNRQYKRNVGRLLQVHYRTDDGSNTEVTGKLLTADDDAVEVEVPGQEPRRIPYNAIHWAKVKLPW